jgi:hypothetical protein
MIGEDVAGIIGPAADAEALFGGEAMSKLISWMICEMALWIWVICASIAAMLGEFVEVIPDDPVATDPADCERSRTMLASTVPSPS